jgi:hypothetical protein
MTDETDEGDAPAPNPQRLNQTLTSLSSTSSPSSSLSLSTKYCGYCKVPDEESKTLMSLYPFRRNIQALTGVTVPENALVESILSTNTSCLAGIIVVEVIVAELGGLHDLSTNVATLGGNVLLIVSGLLLNNGEGWSYVGLNLRVSSGEGRGHSGNDECCTAHVGGW